MRTIKLALIIGLFITMHAPKALSQKTDYSRVSGEWLLQSMSDGTLNISQQALRANYLRDAVIWKTWSVFYQVSANATPRNISALQVALQGLYFCQFQERLALHFNAIPYANLYRGSMEFWKDALQQMKNGGGIQFHFPREMLMALPGAPGSPWERMVIPASRANAPSDAPPPAPSLQAPRSVYGIPLDASARQALDGAFKMNDTIAKLSDLSSLGLSSKSGGSDGLDFATRNALGYANWLSKRISELSDLSTLNDPKEQARVQAMMKDFKRTEISEMAMNNDLQIRNSVRKSDLAMSYLEKAHQAELNRQGYLSEARSDEDSGDHEAAESAREKAQEAADEEASYRKSADEKMR